MSVVSIHRSPTIERHKTIIELNENFVDFITRLTDLRNSLKSNLYQDSHGIVYRAKVLEAKNLSRILEDSDSETSTSVKRCVRVKWIYERVNQTRKV